NCFKYSSFKPVELGSEIILMLTPGFSSSNLSIIPAQNSSVIFGVINERKVSSTPSVSPPSPLSELDSAPLQPVKATIMIIDVINPNKNLDFPMKIPLKQIW